MRRGRAAAAAVVLAGGLAVAGCSGPDLNTVASDVAHKYADLVASGADPEALWLMTASGEDPGALRAAGEALKDAERITNVTVSGARKNGSPYSSRSDVQLDYAQARIVDVTYTLAGAEHVANLSVIPGLGRDAADPANWFVTTPMVVPVNVGADFLTKEIGVLSGVRLPRGDGSAPVPAYIARYAYGVEVGDVLVTEEPTVFDVLPTQQPFLSPELPPVVGTAKAVAALTGPLTTAVLGCPTAFVYCTVEGAEADRIAENFWGSITGTPTVAVSGGEVSATGWVLHYTDRDGAAREEPVTVHAYWGLDAEGNAELRDRMITLKVTR